MLIALLRDPIDYEIRKVNGPGSVGAIYVKGRLFNTRRNYLAPDMPNVQRRPGDWLAYDAYGQPVLEREVVVPEFPPMAGTSMVVAGSDPFVSTMVPPTSPNVQNVKGALAGVPGAGAAVNSAEANIAQAQQNALNAGPTGNMGFSGGVVYQPYLQQIPIGQMAANVQRAAMSLQQQLDADIAAIENYNKGVRTVNDRIGDILHEVSGQPATSMRTAWYQWWIDLLGYTKVPDPKVPRTFIQNIGPFEGNVPLPPPRWTPLLRPPPLCRSNGCFRPGRPSGRMKAC